MTHEQWMQAIAEEPAPGSAEEAAARCILRHLFPVESAGRQAIQGDLARALVAWSRLLHDAGVTP